MLEQSHRATTLPDLYVVVFDVLLPRVCNCGSIVRRFKVVAFEDVPGLAQQVCAIVCHNAPVYSGDSGL